MIEYEIVKQDNKGMETLDSGECETYEDALWIYIDCVLDHGEDDSWLMEDYSRIKNGKNHIRYDKNLFWLEKNKQISEDFISPTKGLPYTLWLKVSGKEVEDYDELGLFKEGFDYESTRRKKMKWKRLNLESFSNGSSELSKEDHDRFFRWGYSKAEEIILHEDPSVREPKMGDG